MVDILKIFRETPVDRNWQIQFKLFKKLKSSTISGFWFRAIEPIRKDENEGKFREISFQ